jgi:hypothetical protein
MKMWGLLLATYCFAQGLDLPEDIIDFDIYSYLEARERYILATTSLSHDRSTNVNQLLIDMMRDAGVSSKDELVEKLWTYYKPEFEPVLSVCQDAEECKLAVQPILIEKLQLWNFWLLLPKHYHEPAIFSATFTAGPRFELGGSEDIADEYIILRCNDAREILSSVRNAKLTPDLRLIQFQFTQNVAYQYNHRSMIINRRTGHSYHYHHTAVTITDIIIPTHRIAVVNGLAYLGNLPNFTTSSNIHSVDLSRTGEYVRLRFVDSHGDVIFGKASDGSLVQMSRRETSGNFTQYAFTDYRKESLTVAHDPLGEWRIGSQMRSELLSAFLIQARASTDWQPKTPLQETVRGIFDHLLVGQNRTALPLVYKVVSTLTDYYSFRSLQDAIEGLMKGPAPAWVVSSGGATASPTTQVAKSAGSTKETQEAIKISILIGIVAVIVVVLGALWRLYK